MTLTVYATPQRVEEWHKPYHRAQFIEASLLLPNENDVRSLNSYSFSHEGGVWRIVETVCMEEDHGAQAMFRVRAVKTYPLGNEVGL